MDIKTINRFDKAREKTLPGFAKLSLALLFMVVVFLWSYTSHENLPNNSFLIIGAVFGAYMAMNIGAHDVANNVGPAVGSKALTLMGAIIIAAVFETLGAFVAGGDVVTGLKFAIDAIAAGKEGADSLHRAVQEGQDLRLGRNRRIFQTLEKDNVDFEGYDRFPRTKVTRESSKENTFQDPRKTFTKEEVERETKRCLECGVAVVDENQCLGCGECTVRCKFDAITLRKEYDAYSYGYENIKKHAIKRELGRKVKIALNPNRDSFEK